ncbi:hypothetical protein ScalyP_jg5649, partial [Parmales sp. scaly parma]
MRIRLLSCSLLGVVVGQTGPFDSNRPPSNLSSAAPVSSSPPVTALGSEMNSLSLESTPDTMEEEEEEEEDSKLPPPRNHHHCG